MLYLNREKFGEKVRTARKSTGMSQTDFAREIGVTLGSVWGYERGVHIPDVEILYNICNLCGVSADHLLGTKNNKPTPEPPTCYRK